MQNAAVVAAETSARRRSAFVASVQERGLGRGTTAERASERQKPSRSAERNRPGLDRAAAGFRRRDADGCDRDGRAPLSLAKDSGAWEKLWCGSTSSPGASGPDGWE
jgi:hypothetical protein